MCDDPDRPDIQCSGDCGEMGSHNCGEAKRCCLCPSRYLCYAIEHCYLAGKKAEDITYDDVKCAAELQQNDRCFKNNAVGCMCCPCALAVCALSIPAAIFTYFGAMICWCCGICKEDSNRVVAFEQ